MTEIDKVREQIANAVDGWVDLSGYEGKIITDILSVQVEVEPERDCPKCNGLKGKYYHTDMDSELQFFFCSTCKGTGRKPAVTKTMASIPSPHGQAQKGGA